MIQVNAIGDACPIPLVKTKNALRELNGPGVVETLVDNEIAVRNLTKLAQQMRCSVQSERLAEKKYRVTITVEENSAGPDAGDASCSVVPAGQKKVVVAIASNKMGEGNDELGAVLIKGFIFALTQQDTLPSTILFYNGGAQLTTEGSPALEDLKSMEAQGVEIITCGTCLNYYHLSDKLQVGEVSNMYTIVERMATADLVIKP